MTHTEKPSITLSANKLKQAKCKKFQN